MLDKALLKMYFTLLLKHRCQSVADAFFSTTCMLFLPKGTIFLFEVACAFHHVVCFAASSSKSWTLELHLNKSAFQGILEVLSCTTTVLTASFLACDNALRLD